MTTAVVVVLGRNRPTDDLLLAGLQVSRPVRDRGIDLIAYADLASKVESFGARPIQMKAALNCGFGLDQPHSEFPNLLIVYGWYHAHAFAPGDPGDSTYPGFSSKNWILET